MTDRERRFCPDCGRLYTVTAYGQLHVHRQAADKGQRSTEICSGSYTGGTRIDPRSQGEERATA